MKPGFFNGHRVAVTGAAGTVGKELITQLLSQEVKEVRALDTDETRLFLLGEDYPDDPRLQIFLCDIRDQAKLTSMLDGVYAVFHAASLKHVPLCEHSPFEAVQTNIIGGQNVIESAIKCAVHKVMFTSSDKAVNPSSVMGTSKLMCERLMTAANALRRDDRHPIFASTRFGNLAGSRGSVIPVFCRQISQGGPVTLTHPGMTRFIMTLGQAVSMVVRCMELAKGGEVFVTKMPVVNIKDLATEMVELLAPVYGYRPGQVEITEIGLRSGEKLYEELLNEEEIRRSYELNELFVVLPAFRNIYQSVNYEYEEAELRPVERIYISKSEPTMTQKEIVDFMLQPGVLPEELRVEVMSGKRRIE